MSTCRAYSFLTTSGNSQVCELFRYPSNRLDNQYISGNGVDPRPTSIDNGVDNKCYVQYQYTYERKSSTDWTLLQVDYDKNQETYCLFDAKYFDEQGAQKNPTE